MTQTLSYYPLTTGNVWTYRSNDGDTYTNQVVGQDLMEGKFVMSNSTSVRRVTVVAESDGIYSDAFEADRFVLMLKANPKIGDSWKAYFTLNGLENMLDMRVIETGLTMDVEGRTYRDVAIVEAESKMRMNGAWMSIQFKTKYHYAPGIGLVLTTSSYGDSQALVDYRLI